MAKWLEAVAYSLQLEPDPELCYEFYCARHMIEVAVAYYECTGKKDLLEVARKLADHIDSCSGRISIRESG